MLLNKSETMSK